MLAFLKDLNCCHLAILLAIANIAKVYFFLNYNFSLKQDQLQLKINIIQEIYECQKEILKLNSEIQMKLIQMNNEYQKEMSKLVINNKMIEPMLQFYNSVSNSNRLNGSYSRD
ncbi:hypothetical protein C1645_822602 [Glomus cerebriforme]|uniref:Uncharacterized protein n=1 Tax=Glomus cerebriforme TaxID=658196 RepID=A0A397T2A3_9GLOM|nr:hypothetical protein C1645_822602 [Glomus cerebriforme]